MNEGVRQAQQLIRCLAVAPDIGRDVVEFAIFTGMSRVDVLRGLERLLANDYIEPVQRPTRVCYRLR